MMTWPPRVWLAMAVIAVLIALLIGVTTIPWYRKLPLAAGTRRLIVASVVLFLVALLATVVFLVPAYWD